MDLYILDLDLDLGSRSLARIDEVSLSMKGLDSKDCCDCLKGTKEKCGHECSVAAIRNFL